MILEGLLRALLKVLLPIQEVTLLSLILEDLVEGNKCHYYQVLESLIAFGSVSRSFFVTLSVDSTYFAYSKMLPSFLRAYSNTSTQSH